MIDFSYKKYSPEYKNQVIELLSVLWKFNRKAREDYFSWKFEENPYTTQPLAFIALDGDKVVSFRGYMVQPIRIGGSIIMNAALADTVTDSQYRRMGLFKGLTAYSIQEIEKEGKIALSTNSSSGGPTLNGYTALGWIPLSERKHRFKISPVYIIKRFIHKSDKKLPIKINSCIVTEKCMSSAMGQLFDMVSNKLCFIVNSDAEYVRWRFRNPQSKFIFSYKYNNIGKLEACVVVKQITPGKYDLVEYFGIDDSAIRDAINALCKALSPIYIIHWTVNKVSHINLNSQYFGFKSLDFILDRFKKFKNPPFLVRYFSNTLKSVDIKDVNTVTWDINKVIADEI